MLLRGKNTKESRTKGGLVPESLFARLYYIVLNIYEKQEISTNISIVSITILLSINGAHSGTIGISNLVM